MSFQQYIRSLYIKLMRAHLSPLWQQRIKLVWTAWGYYPIFSIPAITPAERLKLLLRSLKVDWNVQHAHWPGEMALVMKAIGQRRANPAEAVVEAGCWNGGSTAKLSMICQMLGYSLLIFDSFQGVEYQPRNSFSGTYVATLETVKKNVETYGEISVCKFISGWFADTLAKQPVQQPVCACYIDCDLAKGTYETLQGVLPAMVNGGVICSQDYHIHEVRDLLDSENSWLKLGFEKPRMTKKYEKLVIFTFATIAS